MSSLYVLLNYKIPKNIYKHLVQVYGYVNGNLLDLFGFSVNVPWFEEERVDKERPLYFGVSSDFLSTNMVSFIFFFMNVAIIYGLQKLIRCLSIDNPLRKMFSK